MKGYIYKHTNKKDGRVYIGQTTQDPEVRWGKGGSNYKNQRAFYRDILRQGWDQFDHEVIIVVEDDNKKILKQILDALEIKYIKEYKSMSSDKGYNSVYKDKILHTRVSPLAHRFVNNRMKEGKTFEEAYKLYKKYKR